MRRNTNKQIAKPQEKSVPSPLPPAPTVSVDGLNNRWNKLFEKYFTNGFDYMSTIQSWYTANPYVQNQRLKNLKANPIFYDRETLEKSLESPSNSEMPLRQMSWNLTANTHPYYKIIRMYADILLYKSYAYPKYVEKEEFNTPRFKSDSKVVHKLLDAFQPAYTFRRIVTECLIEGKRAYVLRVKANFTTGKEKVDYFTLQELPSLWWKPVAKSNDSYYVPSFNFTYFWSPGTTVKQFPPEFEAMYAELMGVKIENSDGSWSVNMEKVPASFDVEFKAGEWYLWREIPNAFVFSADESNAWQTPPFLGLFLAGQDLQSYYTLQTQLTSIPLYGILSGEVPLADQNKSGNYVNDLRLSPDLVVGLTAQANSILPAGVSAFFSPFANVKFNQFEEQVNSSKIYTQALQQFLGTSGTSSLISTTEKPSVAQVKASEKIEGRFSDIFYGQFENFMNIVFAKYVELKYTWRFHIFGTIFNEKDRKQELKDGISLGNTSMMLEYLAYNDLDLESANTISDWVDNTGLYDKMKVTATAFNSKMPDGNSDKAGRKSKDADSVDNDSTAASQDSGMNTADMKSFNSLLDSEEFHNAVSDIVSTLEA